LVTAADTWCLEADFLRGLVTEMEKEHKVLAVSSWSNIKYPEKIKGFSSDFFIIDVDWNKESKVWPINFNEFRKKFDDVFSLLYSIPTEKAAFQYKYQKYFINKYKDNEIWRERDKKLRRIIEREPVHINIKRINNWPEIGLYTNPEPTSKREILMERGLKLGKYADILIRSKDLTYYNNYY